jgi:hypothetical protein
MEDCASEVVARVHLRGYIAAVSNEEVVQDLSWKRP